MQGLKEIDYLYVYILYIYTYCQRVVVRFTGD